jgi:multiple sugar transport system substrate-binding protein
VIEATFTRRGFLRLAAGAAAVATGMGCNSGDKPTSRPSGNKPGVNGERPLRIAQWNNYVPGYDRWWDDEYTRRWGERNGIEVVVDHFDLTQLSAHAQADVGAQRHDIFHIHQTSPAPFEDEVIDHREIVEEVEAKVGNMTPFVERSIFNPRTKKYFGFSDFWVPNPVHYRTDLWDPIGLRPDTWENVLAAGSQLKAAGHPIGVGMGQDSESNVNLIALMHSFGASIQDEEANVVINSPATVEAVKMGAAIFRSAMTEEVLGWEIPSNNRSLASGRASLILNAIAGIRAIEAQDPNLAAKIQLLPIPRGSRDRLAPYVVGVYMIWKFSPSQEAAKRFLVDLATDYREPFIQSQYVQIPSFPGAVNNLGELVANDARAQPPGKYGLLAEAAEWSTNLGHPGYSNAATDEVIKASLISQMFASAGRGEMSPEESVRAAEAKIKPIYERWRQQGKI